MPRHGMSELAVVWSGAMVLLWLYASTTHIKDGPQPGQKVFLTDLPVELLEMITERLDSKDVRSFRSMCHLCEQACVQTFSSQLETARIELKSTRDILKAIQMADSSSLFRSNSQTVIFAFDIKIMTDPAQRSRFQVLLEALFRLLDGNKLERIVLQDTEQLRKAKGLAFELWDDWPMIALAEALHDARVSSIQHLHVQTLDWMPDWIKLSDTPSVCEVFSDLRSANFGGIAYGTAYGVHNLEHILAVASKLEELSLAQAILRHVDLTSLTLPRLSKLTITDCWHWEDLRGKFFSFARRHPTLRELNLVGSPMALYALEGLRRPGESLEQMLKRRTGVETIVFIVE